MPRLYREPSGAWSVPGKQSTRAERVEVSTSPADLATLLNTERAANVAESATRQDVVDAINEAAPQSAPPAPAGDERCPRCKLKPEAAQKLADGMEADAIGDRLLTAPQWFVGKVFGALGARFAESRRKP